MLPTTSADSAPKPGMDAFAHVRDPRLRRFLAHYLGLRQGRRIPRRDQISPLDFPDLLSSVFLYEFDPASQDFHIRLAGDHIARMLQTARAGARLSEVFPPAAFPIVLERYRRVCLTPSVMHNVGRVFHNLGGSGYGERIAMPLLGEDGTPAFFLGATCYAVQAEPDPAEHHDDPVTITYTPL